MSLRLLIIIAAILLSTSGFAQDNISFEYIDSDKGLSNSMVRSIIQDRYGFLWFGTQYGLNRYDGYNITSYYTDKGDPDSMGGDDISALFVDSRGDLWIGTVLGGVNKYNYETDNFISYVHNPQDPASLSNNYVRAICEDSQGQLWFGTVYGGLNLMTGEGQFEAFTHDSEDSTSISNNSVTTILSTERGLFVGTRRGLNLFDQEKATFATINGAENVLVNASITHLFKDSSDRVWIATENSGLFTLSPGGELRPVNLVAGAGSSYGRTYVTDILEDSEGNFWFGTANYGLVKHSPGEDLWQVVRNEPSSGGRLPHNAVWAVFEDNSGIIWVGTDKAIAKHNKARDRFRVYLNDRAGNSSLNGTKVFAITPRDENSVWIGSGDGGVTLLNLSNDESESIVIGTGKGDFLKDFTIRVIRYDVSGKIWIGTEGNGLFLYDPETKAFQHFHYSETDPSCLGDNFVRYVYRDSKDRIWIGTEKGGLNLYNREENNFTTYRFTGDNRGPGSERVFFILEDFEGVFWLGTDKGLTIFNPEKEEFNPLSIAVDFSGEVDASLFLCGFEDSNKDLWFGSPSGLYFFDRSEKQFLNFSTRNGLPDNLVYAISEDEEGNIWCSTNDGLVKMNPETFETKVITVFHAPLNNEYNVNAVCRMPSGELLFGAMHGLVRFQPGHLLENVFNPPVYLTSFKKFEEPFDLGQNILDVKEIDILPNDHFISFEFASLDYDNPGNNLFRYKLEGMKDEWINLGNRRYISLNSLPAKTYNLVVQGSNSNGKWSDKTAEITLVVHPHLWDTLWFRGIIALAVILAFVGYYMAKTRSVRLQRNKLRKEVKLRTSQLLEQNDRLNEQKILLEKNSEVLEQTNKELESFTYTVSHDLRAPLRHIAGFKDLILEEYAEMLDDTGRNYFSRISSAVTRMNEMIENFLRFATSTKHDVVKTEVNISRIASDAMMMIRESEPIRRAEVVVTENMFGKCDLKLIIVVLENLLNNAWKYTRKVDRVIIEVGSIQKDGKTAYFVRDNGVGFDNKRAGELFRPFQRLHSDKEFSGSGIGLATVQRIIHRHNGEVWAEGEEGKGSTFFFTLG